MEPGKYYHIYTHANGFENIFRSAENYRFFLRRYIKFITPIADTYAYCLMPNHLHLLIRIKDEPELVKTFGKFETFEKLERHISKQFANLFSSYTQALNKVIKRKGSLFIPNFKRREIIDEYYRLTAIVYIHRNPIHHGFTKKYVDWSWSSYHAFYTEKPTLLKRDEVLEWFGNLSEFSKFHCEKLQTQSADFDDIQSILL